MKKQLINSKKIDERTFDFALLIVDTYKYLIRKNEYVLSKQLLKSGTSIGANVHEAQTAQSKKRLYHKDGNCILRSKRNRLLASIVG